MLCDGTAEAQISQETQVLEELLRHRQSMASESEEMRKKAVKLALEDKNLEHLLEDSKKRKEELESKCDAHRLLKSRRICAAVHMERNSRSASWN